MLSETVLLGNVSYRAGARLEWDAKNMKITNDEAADKSLFMRRISPRDNLNWY